MPIDPAAASVGALLDSDDDRPPTMLNLLRFSDGGRHLYEEYAERIQPILRDYDADTVFAGDCSTTLVAPADYSDWDSVLLVRYPSRQAFLEMVSDPVYGEIADLRSRGLQDTILQVSREWPAGRDDEIDGSGSNPMTSDDADPDASSFQRFVADDDGGPVTMLNLLRYVRGGRALYAEYLSRVGPLLGDLRASLVYAGDLTTPLVPAEGSGWHSIVLARYERRDGLIALNEDPRYSKINDLRHEALETTVLQATRAWPER